MNYINERSKIVGIISKIFSDNKWTWWNSKTTPDDREIANQIDRKIGEILRGELGKWMESGRLRVLHSGHSMSVYVNVGEIELTNVDRLRLERFYLDVRCEEMLERIKVLDEKIWTADPDLARIGKAVTE